MEFQFRFGSIERNGFFKEPTCNHGFNSALVRLRVSKIQEVKEIIERFNSALVRLRVNGLDLRVDLVLWFQFRFGSIESFIYWRIDKPGMQFQFRFGSIESFFISM